MIKEGLLAVWMSLNVDPGGGLIERMQAFELLEQANIPVEISGVCLSACTMYLGLPEVCVQPRTVLGFHSASYTNEKGEQVISSFGNAILMEYYPPVIKKWVTEKKALGSLDMTFMGAEEAWKLGIKKCEKDDKK